MYEESYDNLKLFDSSWKSYVYEDIVISGTELSGENSSSFYSTLSLDKDKVNIVMLHGQISDSVGKEKIKIAKLKNKNIDYLALGHIHSFSKGKIDERGTYAYSGCLEGRGFDESGEKGFVLLTIDGNKVDSLFVPFCKRTIFEKEIDISSCSSLPDVIGRVKDNVKENKDNIFRIILHGEIPYDLEMNDYDIKSALSHLYFTDIKFKTRFRINPSDYENDISLKGEFVRKTFAREDLSEEDKKEITALGLRVLDGGEVDL